MEKKKNLKARVLNIVQYETNPRTGESLHFDETQAKYRPEQPILEMLIFLLIDSV